MKTTIIDKKIAEEASSILLSIGAVSINTKKPFKYASGIYSPMYTDNRLIISHPVEWHRIVDMYIRVIQKIQKKTHIDVLSGTATAAIPHAAAVAFKLKIPMVYVRSSKKDHGKEKLVEGQSEKGKRVLIIEDLVSTGSSIRTNIDAIRSEGGIVDSCIAITTSTMKSFISTIQELNITLYTITDVVTTLTIAEKLGRITKEEKKSVELFLQDPPNWGKTMGFV